MITTRRGRLEENKQQKRLIVAIAGSVGIIIFLALFGVKMLIAFSMFVDSVRGNTPSSQQPVTSIILPPTLDPLPIATYSSQLRIGGTGTSGFTVIVFDNNKELKKSTVAGNGVFTLQLPALKEGQHTLTVKQSDNKGNTSESSNTVTVVIKNTKPALTIDSPDDNATITGDTNFIEVKGTTETDTTVSINNRIAVIHTDNTFSYTHPLADGDNTLTITATDLAGNKTTIERKVTYHK